MKRLEISAYGSITISLFLLILWGCLQLPLPESLLFKPKSTLYLDRHSEPLAFFLSDEEQYYLPETEFEDISPHFVRAAIAVEDRHFFEHNGVDAAAVLRAAFQNATTGSIVSGASTITQQLAKKLLANTTRTLVDKSEEMILATRLEALYPKQEIFRLWAERAPFGKNIVGITAASELYFRKPPELLSASQAAFLAGIPKNPNRYSPFRQLEQALTRRDAVLSAMYRNNFLGEAEYRQALEEPLQPFLEPRTMRSPHFLFHVKRTHPEKTGIVVTSLDRRLQEVSENAIDRHLRFLRGNQAGNAAAVVIENRTGAIRGYVGNSDYFDDERGGKNDMLQSFRQTGSTLKPFLYALAFMHLDWNADSVTLDEPAGFATTLGTAFAPKNIDLDFKGPLTVRQALAESRNIPAVKTLAAIGEQRFFTFLKTGGITFLQGTDDIGLAGALGAAEARLSELAFLYAMLAREGSTVSPCLVEPCFTVRNRENLLPVQTVRRITAILADNTARIGAFGEESPLRFEFDVAAKTGTTRNFRDNYAIGYTPDHTALAWAGNADGSIMRDVTGIEGAGPIFHEIMRETARLGEKKHFPQPDGPATAINDRLPELRLLSPLPNARYAIDSDRPHELQKIRFETTVPAEFFVNDIPVGSGREVFWLPERGSHTLTAKTHSETVEIRFQVN